MKYIELNAFLKVKGIASSGGEAKQMIRAETVKVNGEVDTSKIPNGYMRFNTDTDDFEGYINGRWETIRAPGASTVSIETFGPGDGTETVFGALANVPASQNNLLVFVENVFQIPGENFEMVQNPAGKPAGYYLEFYTAVPFSKTVTVFFGFAN